MALFEELKRRNVVKVTGAYLALGWMIVEMSGTAVPALHLPDWTTSLLLWIGLAGLPFVVAFAWVFELTPEGVKRASEVDPNQSIAGHTGKRLDYIIVAMLGAAMLMFAADRFLPEGTGHARDLRAHGALLQQQDAAVAAPDKSIAVLPFVNMSSDKEQEYFSDGMSEELLNLLAKAPDLKVIARTSSFAFKGTNTPIAEIARQLNVAHVLEGSVRRSGNTVRITAQLIRAADSTHLWSETYDRPMDDIFKVQDEIAGAISGALQITLKGGTIDRREGGTQDLQAYELYLRAVKSQYRFNKESLEEAVQLLKQSTERDPDFGMAWSHLAYTVVVQADAGLIQTAQGYQYARQLAEHALALSPNLAQAHGTLLYLHRTLDWDFAAAETEAKRAFAIDPGNPDALVNASLLSMTLGRWNEAETRLRTALDRDPLNSSNWMNLGTNYYSAGRFEDAEANFRKALELAPDFLWGRGYLGKALVAQGKAEEAIALVQAGNDESYRVKYLPIMLQAAGREIEAKAAMKGQIEQWAGSGAYFIAVTYAMRGDSDLALEWLERAYQQRDSSLPEILGERLFDRISDDPRYKAFLRKLNLPETPPG